MDYYLITLKAIQDFLNFIEEKHWSKWIAEDIYFWETAKHVEHHLKAYHKEGLSDLWICRENNHKLSEEQEPWANSLFICLVNISYTFAKKLSKKLTPTLDDIKINTHKRTIIADYCFDCEFTLFTKHNIDGYISIKAIEIEIIKSLRANNISQTINDILFLNSSFINVEREKVIKIINQSGFNYTGQNGFMRPCANCKSKNTGIRYFIEEDNKGLGKIFGGAT